MDSSSSSICPQENVHDHQRKHFPIPIERRPRMLLKDFLNENSNSCSSSGFKSFPRQSPFDSNSKPTKFNSNSNSNMTNKLLRSRSKAASTTISAFHSLMNAVKNIPFTAVKTPSVLPRTLSRRLSRSSTRPNSSKKESQNEVQITVRIKDIIRWTSFRDEKLPPPPPLDYASSPLHCTTSTTIIASTTTCTTCSSNSSSNGSSWCDSDFTSEFLPSWGGNNSEEGGEKYLPCVGKECMEATTGTRSCTGLGPQPQVEVLECDEDDEQNSPVSVLDFEFGEDEEESFSSTFDQSLANLQRTKEMLMQNTKLFESLATLDFEEEQEQEDGIEEKAMGLLSYVKETSSTLNLEDKLLLDFFREELSAQRNQNDDGFNWEMVSKAKAWVSGEHHAFESGIEYNKEACVRDMHKGGGWNKFECEKEELALEIETAVLGFLVDELLVDLLSR